MEIVRNYLQHQGLPVTTFAYPISMDNRHDPPAIRYSVTPMISLGDLRGRPADDNAVLDSLAQSGSDIRNVTPFIRQYIDGLSIVHDHLRKSTAEDLDAWMSTIVASLDRYGQAGGERPPRIFAYELTDEEETRQKIALPESAISRLSELRGKRLSAHLARSYVSGESET